MISVEMRPLGPTNVFHDGRPKVRPGSKPGALNIYDLRESCVADLKDPYDNLNLFLPRSGFQDFAADRGHTFLDLKFDIQQICYDPVMLHVAQAMLPALERPNEIRQLYLDHLFLAVRDHIAETYGVFHARRFPDQQGLTSHQLSRALEYIEANLSSDIGLADIATAGNASISSLGRGFKAALGVSTHRWVLQRRIALAQRLMADPKMPLSQIAVACGFFDQSHLSRVFVRQIGTPPATWRSAFD